MSNVNKHSHKIQGMTWLFPPVDNFWGYKKCFAQTGHHNRSSAASASQRVDYPVGELDIFVSCAPIPYQLDMLHEITWKTGSGIVQPVSTFISWRYCHALSPELSAGYPVISASLPVHGLIPIRGQVRQGLPLDCRLTFSLLFFCLFFPPGLWSSVLCLDTHRPL